MLAAGKPEHTGIPQLGLPLPRSREDTDQWFSACECVVGVGLSRLALPVATMKRHGLRGYEQQSDSEQHSEHGGSSLVEDPWQEMSFIPVYCGDMMAQLTAACSSTSCAAEQPKCRQTSGERPVPGKGLPSSPAAATCVTSEAPELTVNMISATPAVGRQWGVMDMADLPADCVVSFGPGAPVELNYCTWVSQFHSLCTFENGFQQIQDESLCTLQQQFHSLCLQTQEEQLSNNQKTDYIAATAATSLAHTQHGKSAVQLEMSCRPTAAASTAKWKTPCLKEAVHALPSHVSVESLDSLAVLPLHNPYQLGTNDAGVCGLDAAMFMGEF